MNPVRLLAFTGCLARFLARAGLKNAICADPRGSHGCRRACYVVAKRRPLFYEHSRPRRWNVSGFRPFFLQNKDAGGLTTVAAVLYPVFIYRADSDN